MKIKKSIVSAVIIFTIVISDAKQLNANSGLSADEIFNPIKVNRLWEKYKNNKVASGKSNANLGLKKDVSHEIGKYPTRKGVILVTEDAYKKLIPCGHAAIVLSEDVVCEALLEGVTLGNNNWYYTKATCYGVTVRETTQNQDARVADWCLGNLGKPYSFDYFNLNSRDSFYCSKLIWSGYKDLYNIDLNTDYFGNAIHPVELAENKHVVQVYSKTR